MSLTFDRLGPILSFLLLVPVACGPSAKGDGSDDTNGSDGTTTSDDTTDDPAADETGVPGACGVNDTELIGGGPPGPLGFPPPCNPREEAGVGDYRCCSDDPAAADGAPPDYEQRDIPGGQPPYFSAANNDLSVFGQCVRVSDLVGQGLIEDEALNCPIPCNPTWDPSLIDSVCGPARQCCQTVELQPEDCVMDPGTGLWRPVTGADIGSLTAWSPGDHATHQDPNGTACLAIAGNDTSSPQFLSCVASLTVANQRGYCMALAAGQLCPHAAPDYVDACEALNGG